ncbi:MAG: thiamine phosphate synthase [Thermoguttaceae bacterium]|nr:thiamine phosphate synthase [Thermoguttaceae bacterium]MBQ5367580.1 thiamine phosphate synthase [Thermoguttaceae bacterium]
MTTKATPNEFQSKMRALLRLYAVTDRSWVGIQTLLEQIESSLLGGTTLVQLREKDLSDCEFIQEAISVKRLCERFGVPLLINDNVNVALRSGADGVHLGQDDLPLQEARKMLGPNKIIGISTHTVEEAMKAEQGGADYVGVGSVFATQTKLDANVLSIDYIREICQAVTIPVVAIGGIKEENMDVLRNTGVAGIAVVSAIFGQPDIEIATLRLKEYADRLFK